MLKGNRKFVLILVLCFGALIFLEVNAPEQIDWSHTYTRKDKIPFGTAALHEMLPYLSAPGKLAEQDVPLYNALRENEYNHTNYLIINRTFEPDTLDVRELLRFVSQGNNAFIAANDFEGKFADTLHLSTQTFYIDDTSSLSSLSNDTTRFNFVTPALHEKRSYVFPKGVQDSYFSSIDTSTAIVLAENGRQEVNFIEMPFGRGKFYLCSTPEVFTNYYFVSGNRSYAYKALSYLPPGDMVWDEYYKSGNITKESAMRVLLNNRALRAAYYLSLFSIVIFMLIGIKRRERIIPVIEPLRNTTLEFVNIVGALYFQSHNHKNIADKKITYFLEYLRSTFQVHTNIIDEDLITRVSNLSGIGHEKVAALFKYFKFLGNLASISEHELLKLNKMIEDFHRNSKR